MQCDQALTQWALLSMLRQGGSNFIGGYVNVIAASALVLLSMS